MPLIRVVKNRIENQKKIIEPKILLRLTLIFSPGFSGIVKTQFSKALQHKNFILRF